jgi:hypothetical protein
MPSAKVAKWIDGSLYPDREVPEDLSDFAEQVDYLARLCAAWDFGILPDYEAIAEIRRPEWRRAVDACRLLTSPTYHLLREWHSLESLPFLGQRLAYIDQDPSLTYV